MWSDCCCCNFQLLINLISSIATIIENCSLCVLMNYNYSHYLFFEMPWICFFCLCGFLQQRGELSGADSVRYYTATAVVLAFSKKSQAGPLLLLVLIIFSFSRLGSRSTVTDNVSSRYYSCTSYFEVVQLAQFS